MLYKNAFKLVLSNNNLIWKVLLFFAINALVVFGLLYAFSLPIINVLNANGFFEGVKNVYVDFVTNLNLVVLFDNIVVVFNNFVDIIASNINDLLLNIILFLFTLIVVTSFLNGFYGLVIANVLY